jgi:heat shock protein HslJ
MRLLGLLVVAGISLTACGSEAPPAASIGGGGGSPVGKSYLSVQVTEDGKPKQLAPNTRLRLDFRDGRSLGFHAGCNQMGGEVSLDGGTVTMQGYGGTEMACPNRQAQETWLAKLLMDRPAWKLEGDTLTLSKGSTTVVLKDRKIVEPDLPIAGTRWTVDGVLAGQAVEHFPALAAAHFTIEGDRVTGSTGCNEFEGPVTTRTATTLSLGALRITTAVCSGDPARLERAMIGALGSPLTYSIDYNRLELRTADGKGGLNLIAKK